MASTDPQHVKEINRRFARHVWATIGLSFYDKSGGGILGGRGGHDPAWERVWAAAEKRGEGGVGGGGGSKGFETVEGTREVIRFMVGELKDEYSAYMAPQEIGGLFRRYPSKAQPQLERPVIAPTSSSSTSTITAATTTTTKQGSSSSGNTKDDKADGSMSLSASVGMQLEPAAYCPPATMLQPHYNAATNMYDYPSLSPSSFPYPSSSSSAFTWLPAFFQPSFPPSYSRPCAVVVGVLPNSPAEEAGIRIGDRVSKVGHIMTKNTAGWDRDGTLENTLLQGKEGTSIQVELMRVVSEGEKEGREQRVPLTLRRRSFASSKYPAMRVQSLLDEEGRRVCYIRLHRFDAPATAQLRSVLYAEERVGAEAYVIDLRNNMGGIFQESLKMAALFLPDPKSVLCFTMDAWGGYSAHLAEEYDTSATLPLTASGSRASARAAALLLARGEFGDKWAPLVSPKKPVVVLVNKGSASSSETFAAALHDNDRAWLVGERTFGKSLIQHLFPLPDGGALKLTVAEYLTPKQRHLARIRLPGPTRGRSVSATTFNAGLEPDLAVADSTPRPNSMDDSALTQALDLLAKQPFPERGGGRGQGEGGGKIVHADVFLSFLSHSNRK
ncbi:peptidase s41 [Nannochloropsis oceanica]